jgi:hypothetical protein
LDSDFSDLKDLIDLGDRIGLKDLIDLGGFD